MITKSSRHSPLTLGFVRDHPRAAARALSALDETELASFVDSLPVALAAAVLEHLAPLKTSRCLETLPAERAAKVLAPASSASAAAMLRRVAAPVRYAVLAVMPATAAARLRVLLSYPADTVGSVLEPDVLTFGEHMRIREAVAGARQGRRHLMNLVYVLDDDQRLRGAIDLRDLLGADADGTLQSLMRRGVSALPARATLGAAVAHPAWSDCDALPVTDRRGIFLGVLRRATLLSATRKPGVDNADGQGVARTLLELSELVWAAGAGLLATAARAGADKGTGR